MHTVNNGRTILLGEDELEVRSYLEMALKCHGYSIESAQELAKVLSVENKTVFVVRLDPAAPDETESRP